MRRLHLLLVALLACGLVAAGCGGDDDDDDDQTDAPEITETAPDTTPTDTTDSVLGEDEETDAGPPIGEEAVEACKESIGTVGQLTDDAQERLEEICEQAGRGDEEAVREASVEFCREFAENNLPEGSVREQALEECERAGE